MKAMGWLMKESIALSIGRNNSVSSCRDSEPGNWRFRNIDAYGMNEICKTLWESQEFPLELLG